MPASSITRAFKHSAFRTPKEAFRTPKDPHGLTMEEVIPYLVGHTVDEVERELILHTLVHYYGSRTQSASVLGISIRCMRNKIREYEDLGIAVPTPGEPRVHVGH